MYQDTYSDRNQEATVWVGNLDAEVNEELLVELMMQAGPVMSINMPRDKITGLHQGFSFVEFRSEADADYCMKVMNMVRLIGKTLKINKAAREQGEQDIGANLFVGNLDPDVDEQLLYTTFSAFGQVAAARVMYDEADGNSRGFGFVNYTDFNSADNAMKNMNGQFLCNRPITVSFAFKKGETGDNPQRHGTDEERKLAALAGSVAKVNTKFADAPGYAPKGVQMHNAMPQNMMPPVPMPFQMPMGMMMPPPMPMPNMMPPLPGSMQNMMNSMPNMMAFMQQSAQMLNPAGGMPMQFRPPPIQAGPQGYPVSQAQGGPIPPHTLQTNAN